MLSPAIFLWRVNEEWIMDTFFLFFRRRGKIREINLSVKFIVEGFANAPRTAKIKQSYNKE